MDNGIYPILAEAGHLEAGKNQRLRLKMTGEARNIPRLEKRRSPEEAAKWLEKECPEYAVPNKIIYNCMTGFWKEDNASLNIEDYGKAQELSERMRAEDPTGTTGFA